MKTKKQNLDSILSLIDNCKAYLSFAIDGNRLDVYEYICKRDKLGLKLNEQTFIEAIKNIIDIWDNSDLKNQIYDKKFMGLSTSDSISAVATPIKSRFEYNIPTFKSYLKSL